MRAKRVGRSWVSAITQTPASGPFGPVTTPPMSLPSITTAAAWGWARRPPGCPRRAAATTAEARPRYQRVREVMVILLTIVLGRLMAAYVLIFLNILASPQVQERYPEVVMVAIATNAAAPIWRSAGRRRSDQFSGNCGPGSGTGMPSR